MKTISNISAPASILGFLILYFTNHQRLNLYQIIFLILFTLASSLIIYLDVKNKPKSYKNGQQINKYMYNWISNIGRIAIFTRDMSWSNEKRIRDKLLEKARAQELIICMPQANEFADELRRNGARIVEYSQINYTPQSRFTIVRYQRNDSKIAIGRTDENGKHIIQEFGSAQHPLFYVAQDLVNILTKFDEHR